MFMGQPVVGGGFIQLGPGAKTEVSPYDAFGQGFPGGGFLQRGPQHTPHAMGHGAPQHAMGQGGSFISPAPGAQTEANPLGQFGQGFPGGAFMKSQAPQQVPVVMGQIAYTTPVSGRGVKRNRSNFQNPQWPFWGPTGGQMWIQ